MQRSAVAQLFSITDALFAPDIFLSATPALKRNGLLRQRMSFGASTANGHQFVAFFQRLCQP